MKCRCAKTKKRLMAHPRDTDLPDDLRATLESCPECRAFWSRMQRISGLIALKRYEYPDLATLDRCRRDVHQRILDLQAKAQAQAEPVSWSAVWGTTLPAFRFSMAALFVALLGLHIFSASHLPVLHTSERSMAEHLQRAEQAQADQLAQDERPNPEFTIMMLSNWTPRVQQDSAVQFIGLGQ